MNKKEIRTINDQYFPAYVRNKDDSLISMSDQDRDHYLELLNNLSYFKDKNFTIVRMKLEKKKNVVEYEGFISWNNKKGGFFVNGYIELKRKEIILKLYWQNTDKFDIRIIRINDIIFDRGKVKVYE